MLVDRGQLPAARSTRRRTGSRWRTRRRSQRRADCWPGHESTARCARGAGRARCPFPGAAPARGCSRRRDAEEARSETRLVPDLDVEVVTTEDLPRLRGDRLDVQEPAGERRSNARVGTSARGERRGERQVAAQRRPVGARPESRPEGAGRACTCPLGDTEVAMKAAAGPPGMSKPDSPGTSRSRRRGSTWTVVAPGGTG